MPFYKVHPYLDTVLRSQMATANQLEIKKSLLQSQIRQAKEVLRAHMSTTFEMTETTVCPECRKRFTNPATFVRYPNGEVVHLSCHDKRVAAANLFEN